MNDSQIVDLYLIRDETAITETSLKYGQKLRRIANGVLGSTDSAEECENSTYLEAWNLIPPNEPRTYLFAFLGKIIRHIAIDECRRNSRLKRRAEYTELTSEMEECLPGQSDVEGEVEARALSGAIDAFLKTCPQAQRNVFIRRYWFFETVPEIAARYGFSESKVKSMLFRMRKGLREHLEKEGYSI